MGESLWVDRCCSGVAKKVTPAFFPRVGESLNKKATYRLPRPKAQPSGLLARRLRPREPPGRRRLGRGLRLPRRGGTPGKEPRDGRREPRVLRRGLRRAGGGGRRRAAAPCAEPQLPGPVWRRPRNARESAGRAAQPALGRTCRAGGGSGPCSGTGAAQRGGEPGGLRQPQGRAGARDSLPRERATPPPHSPKPRDALHSTAQRSADAALKPPA